MPRILRMRENRQPMDIVIGDVHHLDILLRRDDGTVFTPKIIAWQDWATNRVFAYPVFLPKAVWFAAWGQQMLCATLIEGDIVILDNLSSHKGSAARDAIRNRGAKMLFLPPYSSDLNPIEQVFSKVKHWMKMAQETSVDDVHKALAETISNITKAQCTNYFRNAGYGAT